MEQILEGKSPAERANLKAEIIAQSLPLGEYEDTAHGLRIEIQGVSAMEGGVQIFARAWKETNQLGFGSD
jgi:hypothetical protein